MLFIKIVTALVGLLIVSSLFAIWHVGRMLAEGRKFTPTGMDLLNVKRGDLMIFTILNFLAIILIRLLVWMSPDPYAAPMMLQLFHYALDGLVTCLFVGIIFWFNGTRYPNAHKYYAYTFIVVYLCVAVTGSILLYLLPM
jgi:tetrahydromethanopterin S-methyltransferase subunit E